MNRSAVVFSCLCRVVAAGVLIASAAGGAITGLMPESPGFAFSASEAATWKKFASAKYRFTVQYPASWYPLPGSSDIGSSDILDITNFERSGPQDGIGSRVAGAEITVTGALPGVKSVDDWIRRDLPDSDEIAASENKVSIPRPAADGCTRLKQAAWREPVSPDAAFAETSYYCTTAGGLYKISLLNWQNDPRQKELRELAVRIALSLRTQ